ncbi:MAG: carboxypeptidase-like regulatory domain-containing protein, partial [Longimicrobiales bacterium]
MVRRIPLLALALVLTFTPGTTWAQQTSTPATAGTGRIVGQITANGSAPVIGAQVFLEGTAIGTVSVTEGRYVLNNVRPGNYKITASMIGFGTATQDVRVRAEGTTLLNFAMTMSVLSLKELVITGVTDPTVGTKSPVSVGRVSQEDLVTVPTTASALAAIQGKVAGVNVVRGSGQPGSGVSIQLRTPTSVQRDNNPLFVVDGVIMAESTVDLSSLQLESMEVIKGAAAASLYGSRAANGVVSITTQRGRNVPIGKTRLTARTEIGSSQAPTNIPVTRTHQFKVNEAGQFIDLNGNPTTNPTLRTLDGSNGTAFMDNAYAVPTYDNISAFFRPGLFNTNTATLSSNSEATSFFVAVTNEKEAGSLENNDGVTKNSVRVNLDHRLGSTFSLQSSIFHSRYRQDELSGSPFFDLLLYPP